MSACDSRPAGLFTTRQWLSSNRTSSFIVPARHLGDSLDYDRRIRPFAQLERQTQGVPARMKLVILARRFECMRDNHCPAAALGKEHIFQMANPEVAPAQLKRSQH